MQNDKISRSILKAAAIYNLIWGACIIFFPHFLFDFAGLPRINYPGVWQCVGMIVGVYGLGYWIAASNPLTHWPIVLVGFLGKILGPIGFVQSYYTGVFNAKFGVTIIFNDLIWWLPFFYILNSSRKEITDYLKKNDFKSLKSFTHILHLTNQFYLHKNFE